MWTTAFAVFFVVERVVLSSTNAMASGALLILGFTILDLVRRRDRQKATLHWLALATTVVAYATVLALVVSIIDFNADPPVTTSISEIGRDIGRAILRYVGHCIAFAMFTVVGAVATVRYRLCTGSGTALLVLATPCVLLATYLVVYHLIYGL